MKTITATEIKVGEEEATITRMIAESPQKAQARLTISGADLIKRGGFQAVIRASKKATTEAQKPHKEALKARYQEIYAREAEAQKVLAEAQEATREAVRGSPEAQAIRQEAEAGALAVLAQARKVLGKQAPPLVRVVRQAVSIEEALATIRGR